MTGPERLDLYDTQRPTRPWTIVIAFVRGIAIVVGLAVGFVGTALYALRCFDACPTDTAENTIIQILTLSLVTFGLVVIVAAVSLRTRWAVVGGWIISVLGVLMTLGGVATLVQIPLLWFPGDRSSTITYGLIDVAAGAALVVLGRRARNR